MICKTGVRFRNVGFVSSAQVTYFKAIKYSFQRTVLASYWTETGNLKWIVLKPLIMFETI